MINDQILLNALRDVREANVISLSQGAPDFDQETLYSIAARYTSGDDQDNLVRVLTETFPEFG